MAAASCVPAASASSDVWNGKMLEHGNATEVSVTGWGPLLLAVHGSHATELLRAYNKLRVAASPATEALAGAPPDAAPHYTDVCAQLQTKTCEVVVRCCAASDAVRGACGSHSARKLSSGSVACSGVAAAVGDETMTHATSLDLSRSYVGLRGFLATVCVLPRCFALQHLSFASSRLDATQIVILAHAASPKHLCALAALDVSHNPFGSVGAEALLELALCHPTLLSINVDGVAMVPALHRRLCDALTRRRQLRSVAAAAVAEPDIDGSDEQEQHKATGHAEGQQPHRTIEE